MRSRPGSLIAERNDAAWTTMLLLAQRDMPGVCARTHCFPSKSTAVSSSSFRGRMQFLIALAGAYGQCGLAVSRHRLSRRRAIRPDTFGSSVGPVAGGDD